MISHPPPRFFNHTIPWETSVQRLYNTLCRAVETATMRIGVKTLAETSGAGVIALTSLIFCLLPEVRRPLTYKRDRAQFFGKNPVDRNLGILAKMAQNCPKFPENGPFRKYLKICSLVFSSFFAKSYCIIRTQN